MGVLILLAVAIFNVGLTLLAGINRFYDMENDRLNGAHYMVRFTGNEYREEYLDFFLQDPRVETAETEEAVLMQMASFRKEALSLPTFEYGYQQEDKRLLCGGTDGGSRG